MSPNRISRWLGAFALGAVLAGCATTPTAPVKSTPAPSSIVSTTAVPTTTTVPTTTVAPVAPLTTVAQQAPPTQVQHAASPARVTTSHKSASCAGGYLNVDGNCVPRPTHAASPPAGATAHCKDGTYSFSQHRQGTCSGHGGVAQWL